MLERACIGTKSTIYKRVVDEATTVFFIDYWGIATRDYPSLRMQREKDRPAMSTWVRLYPDIGLPSHIEVWHKAAETFAVDLQFARTRVEDLHAAAAHPIEPDMAIEQRQKSAVIRICALPRTRFWSVLLHTKFAHSFLSPLDTIDSWRATRP